MGSRNGKRRAVVTGAAGGIGKAVAQRLVAEGVDVLAVDIDAGRLQRIAGEGCATYVADLSDPAQRQSLSTASEGYDYLVNSALILNLKPILQHTHYECTHN